MGSPMVTIPLINAIVFSAYGQAKSWLQGPNATDEDLSVPQLALAGTALIFLLLNGLTLNLKLHFLW